MAIQQKDNFLKEAAINQGSATISESSNGS